MALGTYNVCGPAAVGSLGSPTIADAQMVGILQGWYPGLTVAKATAIKSQCCEVSRNMYDAVKMPASARAVLKCLHSSQCLSSAKTT